MLNGLDKMEANNELQSDAQCKDQLLVMNPSDVLFPAPLSESSRATGIEILAAKASCNPQAASDITNEVSSITMKYNLQGYVYFFWRLHKMNFLCI
jgi:hypothetical protein